MGNVNLKLEVPYYLRDPPLASWSDPEAGDGDYTDEERIQYPLISYLRAQGVLIKNRLCYSEKLDTDVEVSKFKLMGTNVLVRYYCFNEESDWPMSYPQKEVLEVRLSGELNNTRIAMFKRFGLEVITKTEAVLA